MSYKIELYNVICAFFLKKKKRRIEVDD